MAVRAENDERPEAYIPGDRRRALAEGRDLPERVRGAALFADISGFTPLTEALVAEYGPRRGAEELASTLETVIDEVLHELHRHGGSAIYFSGDAVTCWLDGDDGVLAVSCGFAMQDAIARVGLVRLASGSEVRLAMKVAIAVGPARRFVVGDPSIQLIDVLGGALMDDLAAAETFAGQGEVVLTAAAADSCRGRVRLGEQRRSGDAPPVTRAFAPAATVDLPPLAERGTTLPDGVARQWLLPVVYERLRSGRGEFLTELRAAVPIFLRFTGIDYDGDPDAPAQLDAFIRQAQRVVDGYGGNLLQLTIGDKGAYLYLVFGSPLAHENDSARACAAALDLLELSATTSARDISIGVSRGGTRSGTYGHRFRRTFCCLGDPVNLAARLMAKAPAGQVYVADAVRQGAGRNFAWQPLAPMAVKGKAEPVVAHQLLSAQQARTVRGSRRDRPMVGRDRELAELVAAAAASRSGGGRVVGVTGEAGLGKSRLLAELIAGLDRGGTPVAGGEGQAFGAPSGYHAFRDIVLDMFELAPDTSPDELLRRFDGELRRLDPALADRAPLFGALVGADLRDNELTAAMDANLRKGSLELLFAQYLDRRARSDGPFVIVIEDSQWLDPLGQDLLETVLRQIAAIPVLVALGYRPIEAADTPSWLATLRTLPHAHEIELRELTGEAAARLVETTADRVFDLDGAVPAELVSLVLDRAQGNPFHIEELLAFLGVRGADVHDPRALAEVEVPDSLQSLVLSRIDALAELPRRTVKVASVVGRTFDVDTVRDAAPDLDEGTGLPMQALAERDLVVPEPVEDSYAFRHVVVHDVAYESLPFALRARLHRRIGGYLERVFGVEPGSRRALDLLAHHFWHSDDDARKRHYLRAAADAARAAYAGPTAALHYERLITLLPDAELAPVLRRLGEMHELAARWPDAQACYERAIELASIAGDRRDVGWGRVALADVVRKQGSFGSSAELLEQAEIDFGAVGDEAGLGRVLHLRGTLAGQQQQLPLARELYLRSLEIRTRLGDRAAVGSLLANLGIMAEYEGDYAAAVGLTERALAVRIEVGDRWAIGHAQSNLGMLLIYADQLDRAIDSLTEALRLHTEVGDLWMIAIGHENLGAALLRRGDRNAAADHFGTCVAAHRLIDDPWSTAHLLEDVARLATGSPSSTSAHVLAGAADSMRAAIGAPRSTSQQEDLDSALAGADVDPDSAEPGIRGNRDALVAAGRAMSRFEALASAAEVCRSVQQHTTR